MKRLLEIPAVICAATAALFTACEDDIYRTADANGRVAARFSSDVVADSRLDDTQWEEGDQIGIYSYTYDPDDITSTPVLADGTNKNARHVVNPSDGACNVGNSDSTVWLNKGQAYAVMAYYPFSTTHVKDSAVTYITSVVIDKPGAGTSETRQIPFYRIDNWADQSDPTSLDVLWAMQMDVKANEPDINLSLAHQFCRVQLNIAIDGDKSSLTADSLVGMEVSLWGQNYPVAFNLMGGQISYGSALADSIAFKINREEGATTATASAIVAPNTTETRPMNDAPTPNGRTITIRLPQDHNRLYVTEIPDELLFEAGKAYVWNITFATGADLLTNTFYVSANGNDANTGKADSPLATIAAAVEKMNDSDADYTIYVDGMLGRSVETSSFAFGQFIAEIEIDQSQSNIPYVYKAPIQAKSITLMGLNPLVNGVPVDGINPNFGADTNGKMTPVLLVATSVPVTLKNIKLAGGSLKRGEALMVGGSYYNDNDESVDVPANVTIKDGVLITENNNGLAGPYWNPMVSIGIGSVCKMEGGSITDNYAGLGVVSVQKNATFEMTGGSITGNHLYSDADYPDRSISCGISVAAPAEDGSYAGGTFKISGDAVVDEIYLKTGAVVTVAGALTTADKIQIEPASYTDGTQLVEVASDCGVNLSDACDEFAIKSPSDGAYWQVLEDGTLFEGALTETGFLEAELSSLESNIGHSSAENPYKVTLTDNTTDFGTLLASINEVLDESHSYVKLAFQNPGFTKIEGKFSEYVTCLEIPANVTSVGFIDGAGLASFKVASGNQYFAVSGTVLCSKNLNKIYRFPPATKSTSVMIPSNITSIADGAFANCLSIAEFTIADGNTSFKVTTGGSLEPNSSNMKAFQNVNYYNYNSNIGAAPEMFVDGDWNSEYDTWSYQVGLQHVYGYATVGGILVSYDEKTLVACPPALALLTAAEIKTKCGSYEKDQSGRKIDYSAGYDLSLYFDEVKPYALCGVKNVKDITLNVTATSVPAYTFKDCSDLKYVTLNHNGSTVGSYTFCDCKALESAKFYKTNMTTVQSNAFYGCTALKSLWFYAGEYTGKAGTASDAYPSTCNVTISGQVN